MAFGTTFVCTAKSNSYNSLVFNKCWQDVQNKSNNKTRMCTFRADCYGIWTRVKRNNTEQQQYAPD